MQAGNWREWELGSNLQNTVDKEGIPMTTPKIPVDFWIKPF